MGWDADAEPRFTWNSRCRRNRPGCLPIYSLFTGPSHSSWLVRAMVMQVGTYYPTLRGRVGFHGASCGSLLGSAFTWACRRRERIRGTFRCVSRSRALSEISLWCLDVARGAAVRFAVTAARCCGLRPHHFLVPPVSRCSYGWVYSCSWSSRRCSLDAYNHQRMDMELPWLPLALLAMGAILGMRMRSNATCKLF